uniref:CCHC-type domain-containing protein n=1 Tax=Oryzias melastigma TaxID=30732 RepID=A0A3B3BXF5_ORYME
ERGLVARGRGRPRGRRGSESTRRRSSSRPGRGAPSASALGEDDKGRSAAAARNFNPKEPSSKREKCCFRCGSSTHLADSPDCPARKVTCRNCNKPGHFARVCKSKPTAKVGEVVVLELNTVQMLQDGQMHNKITWVEAM